MDRGNLSRRGFLQRSVLGMTAAGLPAWFAKEQVALAEENAPRRQNTPPNERIVMGAIGVSTYGNERDRGGRGHGIMRQAMGQQGVQMVAVCDVDRHNREFAARSVGEGCRQYSDFRELLRRDDIDAVTIGTPDHWHAIIAAEAMRQGKDVYCEKPLTLTLNEGKALVQIAQRTRRVFQTGSQQRSENGGRFRLACELVRNGRIGTVRRIETRIGSNPVGGPFQQRPVPDGLDWNFWLGRTPMVPYVPERCHYNFRWWYDYSGGKMTDWGAHHNDIAQWALNMDESGPVEVRATGEEPSDRPNSYNCHPHFEVTYTYANGPNGANGTVLVCSSRGENGVRFEGDDGRWIFVSRGALRASDPRILSEELPQNATRLPRNQGHMHNFISCVRSRQQPICHVGVGHRSVSVCHIGNIAVRTGQRLRWNPEREMFVDNEQANAMLDRPYRAPWRLEVGDS